MKLQGGDKPPWDVLDDLLTRGELRSFIESHPEFQWHPRDDGKGMIISWAAGPSSASQADPPLLALPSGPCNVLVDLNESDDEFEGATTDREVESILLGSAATCSASGCAVVSEAADPCTAFESMD